MKPIFKLYMLVSGLVLMVLFQNCTGGFGSSSSDRGDSSSAEGKQTAANGSVFDGKISGFFQLVPKFQCLNESSKEDEVIPSYLVQNGGRSFTLSRYVSEPSAELGSCLRRDEVIDDRDIIRSPFQKDFLVLNDSIFTFSPSKPKEIPANLAEIICRDNLIQPRFEFIAFYDSASKAVATNAYTSDTQYNSLVHAINNGRSSRLLSGLNTSGNPTQAPLSYIADSYSLDIDIYSPLLPTSRQYPGVLTFNGSQKQLMNLTCVRGGGLDSTIWPLKQVSTQAVTEYKKIPSHPKYQALLVSRSPRGKTEFGLLGVKNTIEKIDESFLPFCGECEAVSQLSNGTQFVVFSSNLNPNSGIRVNSFYLVDFEKRKSRLISDGTTGANLQFFSVQNQLFGIESDENQKLIRIFRYDLETYQKISLIENEGRLSAFKVNSSNDFNVRNPKGSSFFHFQSANSLLFSTVSDGGEFFFHLVNLKTFSVTKIPTASFGLRQLTREPYAFHELLSVLRLTGESMRLGGFLFETGDSKSLLYWMPNSEVRLNDASQDESWGRLLELNFENLSSEILVDRVSIVGASEDRRHLILCTQSKEDSCRRAVTGQYLSGTNETYNHIFDVKTRRLLKVKFPIAISKDQSKFLHNFLGLRSDSFSSKKAGWPVQGGNLYSILNTADGALFGRTNLGTGEQKTLCSKLPGTLSVFQNLKEKDSIFLVSHTEGFIPASTGEKVSRIVLYRVGGTQDSCVQINQYDINSKFILNDVLILNDGVVFLHKTDLNEADVMRECLLSKEGSAYDCWVKSKAVNWYTSYLVHVPKDGRVPVLINPDLSGLQNVSQIEVDRNNRTLHILAKPKSDSLFIPGVQTHLFLF